MSKSKKRREFIRNDPAISKFASQVIAKQLSNVDTFLEAAIDQPDNLKHVHKLRVSVRRSMTALSSFKVVLPPDQSKSIKSQLREVRRAAGNARDLDVLIKRYSKSHKLKDNKRNQIIVFLEQCRNEAQPLIKNIHQRLIQKNYKAACQRLVAQIRWLKTTDEPTLNRFANRSLSKTAKKTFAKSNISNDIKSLHEFRICIKKLRYEVELYTGTFLPSKKKKLHSQLAKIQDQLGRINDHATAEKLFRGWKNEHHFESVRWNKLIKKEARQVNRLAKQFLSKWSEKKAGKLKAQFENLMGWTDEFK